MITSNSSIAGVSLLLICSCSAFAQEPVIKKIENVTAPIRVAGSPMYVGTPTPAAAPAPKAAEPKPVGKTENPLQGLANTVTSARPEELPLRNFNGYARMLSIPEQPETQGRVYNAHQTIDGVRRGLIVRRMTDPARTDMIAYVIRGDTMHIYQTAPDGLLVAALQRRRDGTTTTASGREVDTSFRDEIQIWRNWERDYLRQLAQADANRK